uniref:Cytolysin Oshem 2 n=1 Tax=Olindias sambaquiensis TaxID=497392 RepID=CYT2_OLISA|nr:RecName: Full=Cytolysin Oshem 2; AltName: Full=Small basic hemolytic peptide [Olindias sambaquiensis]
NNSKAKCGDLAGWSKLTFKSADECTKTGQKS